MKNSKKIISMILSFLIVSLQFPSFASINIDTDIVYAETTNTTSDGFTYIIDDDSICITGYIGSDSDITIKSNYNDIPVKSIENNAFKNNTTIKNVVIQDGITSIGTSVFQECTSLESVYMPNSVTFLGDSAFWCCYALKDITLSNQLTEIGWGTFLCCSSLKNLIIPEGVTTINDYSFPNTLSLDTLVIPKSVTYIDEGAINLNHCGLKNVFYYGTESQWNDMEVNGLKDMDINVFYITENDKVDTSIPNIDDFILFNGNVLLKYIGSDTNVTIPDGVLFIGDDCFKDNKTIESVTVPNSVVSIESSAFQGCSSLQDIVILDGVTSTPNA